MADRSRIDDASAVILTGGKSSRMGRAKALLPFDGEPLIVHIARALGALFADIVVVAAPGEQFVDLSSLLRSQPDQPNEHGEPNKPDKPKVTLVRDEVAHQGPVAGICYGLKAAGKEICFVTSCDVPFLNPSLISHLTSEISNYDVVVPFWQERLQPLFAAYRRSVAPLLQDQLERGELRPISLYEKVRTREVREDEIRRFDPEGLSFLNMNSPEDYQAALRRWQELHRTDPAQDKPQHFEIGNWKLEIGQERPVTCTVELFSVARLLAKTDKVSIVLPEEATLSHVFSALAEKLPKLVGPVITLERNSLTSGNACNINGRDFVRDPGARVHPGDSIFIISADAGG